MIKLPSNGWLILDKPVGISSTHAGSKIKRIFKQKKIGHAGTLDPFASGILPLALGEATKTMPFLMNKKKVYEFTLSFGSATSTDDTEGEVVATSENIPSIKELEAILPNFIGTITQIPPKYSAIKIQGKSAYKLSRKGIDFEIPERKVEIYNLKLQSFKENLAKFTVECGSGTYIRALGRDIALSLNTFGHLTQLRRTKVGNFSIESSIALEKLIKMDNNTLESFLNGIGAVLDDIPAVSVSWPETDKVRKGQPVVVSSGDSESASLWSDQFLIALGHISNGMFYPDRVFNNN